MEISTSFKIYGNWDVVGPCQNAVDMHRLAAGIVTGRKNLAWLQNTVFVDTAGIPIHSYPTQTIIYHPVAKSSG